MKKVTQACIYVVVINFTGLNFEQVALSGLKVRAWCTNRELFYPWFYSLQEGYKPYLRELENRKPIPKYTKRRLTTIEEQPKCDSDEKMPEGAMVIDDENSNSSVEIIEKKNNLSSSVGPKCKLLQFHKNYRPAYYGTWRKRSSQISPKNPFKKDMV